MPASDDSVQFEKPIHPVPVSSESSLASFSLVLYSDKEGAGIMETSDHAEFAKPESMDMVADPLSSLTDGSASPRDPVAASLTDGSASPRHPVAASHVAPARPAFLSPPTMSQIPVVAGSSLLIAPAAAGSAIPEFLYQLTKMLTDDNKDVIEWSNGVIEVHSPHKLESQVLHKYFRHSKFASFQRQLNYFGFRKLAGKGKMAPCSYANEAAVGDINNLLLIKRKTTPGVGVKEKSTRSKKDAKETSMTSSKDPPDASLSKTTSASCEDVRQPVSAANPVLAGIICRSLTGNNTNVGRIPNMAAAITGGTTGVGLSRPVVIKHSSVPGQTVDSSQQHAIAQRAVGKGIRHNVSVGAVHGSVHLSVASTGSPHSQKHQPPQQPPRSMMPSSERPMKVMERSLEQLATNYRNSLNDLQNIPPKSHDAGSSQLPLSAAAQQSVMISIDVDPTPLSQMAGATSGEGPSTETVGGGGPFGMFTGFLSRNSSLVDLAMIPTADGNVGEPYATSLQGETGGGGNSSTSSDTLGLSFVDFPHPEVFPSYMNSDSN